MNKKAIVRKVLELTVDILRAAQGKAPDGQHTNPQYYINKIKQLLIDELVDDETVVAKIFNERRR